MRKHTSREHWYERFTNVQFLLFFNVRTFEYRLIDLLHSLLSKKRDAPELLEEFWERQRKVDHGYRTRKKRQLATRPSDVPEEQPVKRKTKKIKQPRVVIASPYSSDDDTITQKGNLEIITTPLQQKYTCAPATSLSLSPKGSNQRLPLWGWTLPAAKATISETPVPSASKPTPTPIAALAAATSPSEKLQPCYNTNVNTLNNDCSSHKDYLRWYPDPASTANTKFNEVAPETLASVNRATLPYPVHNRQTILSTDKLSLRRNEKDGTPIIVFNNLDLQVHNHFRDDWNWEEQISHIVKLLMKKHEGVPTFYYVVRW